MSFSRLFFLVFSSVICVSQTQADGNVDQFFNEKQILFHDFKMYGPGCLIPGLPIPKKQIDQRLMPGATFELVEQYQNGFGPLRRINKEIVTWINTGEKIGYFQNFIDVVEVPGLSAGFQNYRSCPMVSGNMVCESYPKEAFHSLNKGDYEFCIAVDMNRPSYNLSSGDFRMANGTVVKGYRKVEAVTSGYECKGLSVGEVTTTTTTITTNELPSFESDIFCGGVPVYQRVETKTLDGKVISNFTRELELYKY